MDNFKDIYCRIFNIHGRISCQTGVRVSIFRLCRCIEIEHRIKSKFAFNLLLINENSQTNVKIDINYVNDNQSRQEHNNNKELGIFVF